MLATRAPGKLCGGDFSGIKPIPGPVALRNRA